MREPPPGVADDDVVAVVRRAWDPGVDAVTHLPVGFGAHHWAAYVGTDPRLFVTYDSGIREATELEAAYAGALALREAGLELVLAPVPTIDGNVVVGFADGTLSCTPWRQGTSDPPLDVAWTTEALRRLRATPPPAGLPLWRPKVGPDLAHDLGRLTRQAWGPGPYAAEARDAVRRHLTDVEEWTTRYHHLAEVAADRAWVVCHGEPHHANQLLTAEGRLLVDWDTLRLAPAELDLRVLVEHGVPPADAGADRELLELFDLEWRLDEISQYAAWFAAPHAGTRDDDIAIGGLQHELGRPEPAW